MEIIFSPTAVKHLQKIGPVEKKKARKKIGILKDNPLLGKQLGGVLLGYRSYYAWPLRIIYSFDPPNQTLYIYDVDYRGKVYD
ncbi:hypothetical protein A2379_00380 [Candidatus Amesbacteria bacterium RIFOXYB1_FULL_47_13]|nr:MAG: hypothetical protein A2379_00380 [Candidatus Amesbacteria bacterium RIFOXYB1_FULL_47_13]HBC72208.1 type II toxin-antitoxin system mRNA interferase toxin, RelE/StbE family [Candidatus Amesbacteria bacterium]